MAGKVAVYVSSYDAYADILPHFFARFFRYWPDCTYKVCLGGVNADYTDSRITTVKTAASDWSTGAIECLNQIDSTYVIVLLDDYLLDRAVDSDLVARYVALMDRIALHAIRLNPVPGPDKPVPAIPDLGLVTEGSPNRTSMHATLWRRESLLNLLRAGESIWEFEIYGSLRSNQFPGGVWACWRPAISYVMGLNRGKWFRRALRSLASDGIAVDAKRPVETRYEEWRDFAALCVATTVRTLLPLRWRQRIHRFIDPHVYRF